MKVLITGGAGFIGSTVASACLDAGHDPVLLDDLSTGAAAFLEGRASVVGDVADGPLVDSVFAAHPDIAAVVHCAAHIVVPESVAEPLRYYANNVAKTIAFLDHLRRNNCRRLVFSSSAAVYGPSPDLGVDEDSLVAPSSPYGRTKAMTEDVLADVAAAGEFDVVALRYFNPIGADPHLRTGLQTAEPTHVLGRLLSAYRAGTAFTITGTDWPTPDGTGVRDYVHVWDLARAHVHALERFDSLAAAPGRHTVLNIGTGRGTSVRELVAAFAEVTGTCVQVVEAPRREGDIIGAFARVDRAHAVLGWQAEFGVADGIRDSLAWLGVRDRVLAAGASTAAR